jgi:hypothetical protein
MYKQSYKTFLFFILFAFPFLSNAQYSLSLKCPLTASDKGCFSQNDFSKKKDDGNGLYIGVNLGFYFANRNNALYYNGSGVNNVDSTINYSLNYPRIKEVLLYNFTLAELPAKMHYSPSFLLGVYLKYAIKNSGIFMQFNFSRLKANDVFTLIVDDPNNYSSEPVYKQEAIWGVEQRASIDLGYSYTFNPEKNYRPFLQFGANLTTTKFIDNKIRIENLEYSITNYYFNYYKIEQGGVGFGGFAGCGMNLIFSESISIMPTLNIYYTQAKMGELTKPRFNYTFYISAILNGIL